MKCPDSNRLVELLDSERGDLELRAHLQGCSSCRAEFRLIQELPAAFRPKIPVPEILVQRVMMGVAETPATRRSRVPGLQLIGAGMLGVLTTLITIVATGSIGVGGPGDLLAFALAAGLGAGLMQHRAVIRVETSRI